MSVFILLITLILFSNSCTSNECSVVSPNGKNKIVVSMDESGMPIYSVFSYDKVIVKPSKLGIDFENKDYQFEKLRIANFSKGKIDESYELPTGKTRIYENRANTGLISFEDINGKFIKINLCAYDDGVAFNYEFENEDKVVINNELTEINIASTSSDSWIMNYNPNYESFYPKRQFDSIQNQALSYPALLHLDKKIWLMITEAAVYDQPATHIVKKGLENKLNLVLPEKFEIQKHYISPWRTFILGKNLSTIVESVIVENLNPSSVLKDTSWIEPGIAVFPWWGNYLANSHIDTLKMYVDMAAEMKWQWIEFDVSLVNSPWRTSKDWRTTDWLGEFTAYAKSKGIKVYGWDEINVLDTEMDYVYGKYRDLGIDGIKIDYIDSDDAFSMRFRDRAMREAAKYKLHVSFHGETLPRGQRRKYPNVMTLEGVRGAEYYTFRGDIPPTPEHNCTLPFTRNVVGSMDYTPVTFTIRDENPRKTTYAHELALAVIFESGWTVMADRPQAYLTSPAKTMLQQLVSTWDETVFLDGYPGEFICLARRHGNDWYVAGINAAGDKEISLSLDFLRKGNYKIEMYSDDSNDPLSSIKIEEMNIDSSKKLKLKLIENGGFCTIFKDSSR